MLEFLWCPFVAKQVSTYPWLAARTGKIWAQVSVVLLQEGIGKVLKENIRPKKCNKVFLKPE